MESFIYMRFSVIPFHVIVDYLNLTSSAFVVPIFRTALLNILNETVVNCYEVQRYRCFLYWLLFTSFQYHNRRITDTQNDWARIECIDGLLSGSQDLITFLMSRSGSFSDMLPMVNSSSLVIGGQFNFSSNGS